MYKVTIYWIVDSKAFRVAVHEKYNGIPDTMSVNGESEAILTEEELTAVRRGEPKYLRIRHITKL